MHEVKCKVVESGSQDGYPIEVVVMPSSRVRDRCAAFPIWLRHDHNTTLVYAESLLGSYFNSRLFRGTLAQIFDDQYSIRQALPVLDCVKAISLISRSLKWLNSYHHFAPWLSITQPSWALFPEHPRLWSAPVQSHFFYLSSAMAAQIKQDLNRSGWESTDFPSVCESCLPDNPYVQMLKEDHGKFR